jgi:hypothetical protein
MDRGGGFPGIERRTLAIRGLSPNHGDEGVLHLPQRLASTPELERSRTPLRAIEFPRGVINLFVRAKDLISLRPDLEGMIRSFAVGVGCVV